MVGWPYTVYHSKSKLDKVHYILDPDHWIQFIAINTEISCSYYYMNSPNFRKVGRHGSLVL